MGEFKLILNRNSLADILPPGGASRVTGRRDASRVHARSEAGFRRLLEAEAIYREYHLSFVSLRFPECLEIQLATCDPLMQSYSDRSDGYQVRYEVSAAFSFRRESAVRRSLAD